ncbi:hypothetical protein D3C71_1264130 [compost metagenome]
MEDPQEESLVLSSELANPQMHWKFKLVLAPAGEFPAFSQNSDRVAVRAGESKRKFLEGSLIRDKKGYVASGQFPRFIAEQLFGRWIYRDYLPLRGHDDDARRRAIKDAIRNIETLQAAGRSGERRGAAHDLMPRRGQPIWELLYLLARDRFYFLILVVAGAHGKFIGRMALLLY